MTDKNALTFTPMELSQLSLGIIRALAQLKREQNKAIADRRQSLVIILGKDIADFTALHEKITQHVLPF